MKNPAAWQEISATVRSAKSTAPAPQPVAIVVEMSLRRSPAFSMAASDTFRAVLRIIAPKGYAEDSSLPFSDTALWRNLNLRRSPEHVSKAILIRWRAPALRGLKSLTAPYFETLRR